MQGQKFVQIPSIDNSGEILAAKTKDILEKLPNKLNFEALCRKFPCEYLQPLNAIVHREVEFLNRLLDEIKSSLTSLVKTFRGSMVMTEEFEALANELLIGCIPTCWEKYLYPTTKNLSEFLMDFVERIKYFCNWITREPEENSKTPSTFWISGFCYVQGFLTAVLQRYSRVFEISICDLTYDFEVNVHINNKCVTMNI